MSVPASAETAEDIARSAAVNAGIMLGGDLNIIKPNASMNNADFLALNLSNDEPKRDLTKRIQEKSVVYIHNIYIIYIYKMQIYIIQVCKNKI